MTSFTFRLHPLERELLAGHVVWALEDAPEVLAAYRAFAAAAPPEVATIVTLRRAPATPHLPTELHGRPVCLVGMMALAEPAAAQRMLAPMRSHGRPLLDLVRYRPYTNLQSMVDATVPHGWHYYWKAAGIRTLDDDTIDRVVEHTTRASSPWSFAVMFHLGGQVADAAAESTAYTRRHIAHELVINAVGLPDEPLAETEQAWARAFLAAAGHQAEGAYVNFLDHDDGARAPIAYSRAAQKRLDALRHRFDPTGVLAVDGATVAGAGTNGR